MLRPVTTSSASAGNAPVPVHASAAAELSTNETRANTAAASSSAGQQQGSVSAEQMFRYNSFEFIYRQDIGRIVLIGQSPETGERVIQVPSEQVLRAYERTARAERQLDRIQSQRAASKAAATAPTPEPTPQLTKALVAAVGGDNHGSGVVSLSA
ncbi:MAG: hypothetical protein R3D05_09810 [Dongiaceae bacterium]